ncbi:MAG: PD-(D/E)XK nuclease family protein [Candidatus Marinimicrobia bacterium]|nr:PD-(D/E)XK nuclease family protein [Candidatus Neomarinimicrobiota bacterium]
MTKNEILQTIELRQSSIKDHLNCPLMFRFKHIEQIPETFRCSAALHGTALHKVIHRLHTEDWNLPLRKAYMEALDEAVAESDVEVRWKDTPEKYCENAIEILEWLSGESAELQKWKSCSWKHNSGSKFTAICSQAPSIRFEEILTGLLSLWI